ncbi:DUF2190 family protein [Komagataeibacter europaeus]|uniref:DUF2190 family protein n=1 Tax=Komagataeibacter europaeus TaxID=33995 RepID=UPI000364C571|nr:capsid cement protein [Komagataeibacter europaeus]
MRNYVQNGQVITIPAPVDTASGDLVVIGSLVGVASGDAAVGDDLDVERNAVFDLPKNGTGSRCRRSINPGGSPALLPDDITPYTIRHTITTELFARGVPPGRFHASPGTTCPISGR